jgi:twitching motility protein PilT
MVEVPERTKEIHDAITQGHNSYGMQTFDQSLMTLLNQKHITYEEALRQSSNPDDFALRVKGVSSTSDTSWEDFEKSSSGSGGGGTGSAPPADSGGMKIERF